MPPRVTRTIETRHPVPPTLHPIQVLRALRTFTPAIRSEPNVVQYRPLPVPPGVLDDPFFWPEEPSGLTAYEIMQRVSLAPGLTRDVPSQVIFQLCPGGYKSIVIAPAGVRVWTTMRILNAASLAPFVMPSPEPAGPDDAAVHDAAVHDAPLHDSPFHNAPLHNAPLHDSPFHNAPLHNAPLHDAAAPGPDYRPQRVAEFDMDPAEYLLENASKLEVSILLQPFVSAFFYSTHRELGGRLLSRVADDIENGVG